METVYDWITLAIFAGLIVLFLQRSSMDEPPDRIWDYLPPAIGCAAANYLGNEGYMPFAVICIVATLAYIHFVFKPFRQI